MNLEKPRVLCVDDEPLVLEAFGHYLRRRFSLVTATSGQEALALLQQNNDFAVIISDLSMPGMNGTTFLAAAQKLAPTAIRLLLTGNADLESAIHAVNEGQIFRFLTKPCPMPALISAIQAGVDQHQLVTAERTLLQETLLGTIQTLTDLLSMTSPLAFGRATRLRTLAVDVAKEMGMESSWVLESAAILSQLGYVALPDSLATKLYYGHPLEADEAENEKRVPTVAAEMLANIPRLEPVRETLCSIHIPWQLDEPKEPTPPGAIPTRWYALILKAAMDFDRLEAKERVPQVAGQKLLASRTLYHPRVLGALVNVAELTPTSNIMTQVSLDGLKSGMEFAADVFTRDGQLLVARGFRITPSFLERIQHFRPGTLQEPLMIRTLAPEEAPSAVPSDGFSRRSAS